MKFKNQNLKQEYWKLTPKARYLAGYIEYLLWKLYKIEATITCIYYEGGSGIHSQWRAFDISTKEISSMQIIHIQEKVNATFPYDINRPRLKSCIYHIIKEDKIYEYRFKNFIPAYHLHMQVWVR